MQESKKPLISIIVCSIRPQEAEALSRNVAQTIGVEHEMIIHDNRGSDKGICQVYNECAERAQGEYLCFAHEDISFLTKDWGREIISKLSEQECGVIGFAGSTVKYAYRYGWQGVRRFTRKNYLAGASIGKQSLRTSGSNAPYCEVICLDGMCLLVRKDVWAKFGFDHQTFEGFHSYDTDFTTSVAYGGYHNYVCHSVLVEHRSTGSFSKSWYESVLLYNAKWAGRLPLYAKTETNQKQVEQYAAATEAFGLKLLLKFGILPKDELWREIKGFWLRNKFSLSAYILIIRYLSLK